MRLESGSSGKQRSSSGWVEMASWWMSFLATQTRDQSGLSLAKRKACGIPSHCTYTVREYFHRRDRRHGSRCCCVPEPTGEPLVHGGGRPPLLLRHRRQSQQILGRRSNIAKKCREAIGELLEKILQRLGWPLILARPILCRRGIGAIET